MAEEPDLLISAGFSDAQLVREANKIVDLYKKKGAEAEKAFVDAQGKVTNTKAVEAHKRELDRLSKAYDPAYRAAKQYEVELKKLDRALDIGAISQKQYTAQVEQAAAALQRVNQPMVAAAQGGKRLGGSFQQVGYQVGDFAVQVGAGTSAAQALGQQLPQLLGAFGAFGALAGAAAAIAIPLGAALFKMGDKAETAEDRIKELSEATDAYVEAAGRASTPIDDLRAKYGELADTIQRVSGLQATIAGAVAQNSLDDVVSNVAKSFGSADVLERQAAGKFFGPGNTTITKNIDELAERFGVTRKRALELIDELKNLEDAKGAEAQIKALEALLAEMTRLAGGADALADKMPSVFTEITAALEEAGKQVEASSSEQEKSIQRIVEKYDETTNELRELADERAQIEGLIADAAKRGNDEQVAALIRSRNEIDKNIEKLRELAKENDFTFTGMAAKVGEYAKAVAGAISDRIRENAVKPEIYASQYVADRANGDGARDEELVRAVVQVADQLGIAAKDLLAVMSFETGGKLRPDVLGPTTKHGQHFGLIQFGQPQGARYGVSTDSSITQQVVAAGKYLQDAGVKAGDNLANVYAAVLAGDARKINASDLAAGGVVGNVTDATGGSQFAPHIAKAEGLLTAYGGVIQASRDTQKELENEVKEREKLKEQVTKYGEQLQQNLLTAQQQSDLEAKRAEQISAIKAQDLTPEAEADAIAAVNAELEKQATILKLVEEAKRRGVDLNERMAGSSLTYKEAIAALGEAQRQQALNQHEVTKAQEDANQAQEFFKQQQQELEQGIVSAIVNGENFADVLGNIAKKFAEAALQAALFGSGPLSGGGASLGGIFGSIKKFLGFADGGYTGSGGKYQAAGIVHRGEYVMDADSVRRAGGPAAFDALRRGLKGYADGGYVMPSIPQPIMPRMSAMGQQAPKIIINNNAPGVDVQADYATKDEVNITVAKAIAGNSRRQADSQYLNGRR